MTCGATGNSACKIGAKGPGGGWIFFVDYNDQYADFDYLEAASVNLSAVTWCNTSTNLSLSTWSKNAVGAGSANTTTMLKTCTSGAAKSARGYTSNGKSDWFLGSTGEMMLMYTNLRQAGAGDFSNDFYWSSTEYSSTNAWLQSFNNGDQSYNGFNYKNTPFLVRPIRAF
jgi:hypothetical protein